MEKQERIPLAVIVGPTASGKTALGIEVAGRLNGEIISADSMQLYRGMEIATAKPTQEEMAGIPHHLIGVLGPEETFSVAEYAVRARAVIREVSARGKLPILLGGTGLYVNAVVDNIQYEEAISDPSVRKKWQDFADAEGKEQLHQRLAEVDPDAAAAIHPNNTGRVIRALEVFETTGVTITEHQRRSRLTPSPYDLRMIGLTFAERQNLYRRIDLRVTKMAEQGLEEEARRVLSMENLSPTAAQAIGYKELKPYFAGNAPWEECLELLRQETRRYAKRQLTWFRRDSRIHWLEADRLTPEELTDTAVRIASGKGAENDGA